MFLNTCAARRILGRLDPRLTRCVVIKPKLLKNVGRAREQGFCIDCIGKCYSSELCVTSTIRRPNVAPVRLKGNEMLQKKPSDF